MSPHRTKEPLSESILLKKSLKMDGYDEDLNENPFFRAFMEHHIELFSQCVLEQWLICVPRRQSLPKYAFTLEDFNQHILKPIETPKIDEIESGSESRSESSSNPTTSHPHSSSHQVQNNSTSTSCLWNYRTLSRANVEYSDKKLVIDLDHHHQEDKYPANCTKIKSRSVPVLFTETFYLKSETNDKKKYKVLCISSPLNSNVSVDPDEEKLDNNNCPNEIWNISSLRDAIDFLWIKGRLRVLESFDAHIKLFLHNHRSLENLPLVVQKDLVYSLYSKCLSLANAANNSVNNSAAQSGDYSIIQQSLNLATETYILNGIYKQLIKAVINATSNEDSHLNKIIRNLSEILPQDLKIDSLHWDSLRHARLEMNRMNSYTSPLGKMNCLKKSLRYLKSDTIFSTNEKNSILSADELLPIWIYLIIKAPIGNWFAQLQFLNNFRFSSIDQNDNENSYYISCLEAAISHLNSGKVHGMCESERDVGYEFERGESWLHALHQSVEEGHTPELAQMFTSIRQGNSELLIEIIENYEKVRGEQVKKIEINSSKKRIIDRSELCHPLCNCKMCYLLLNPKTDDEKLILPAVQLTNEEGFTILHLACIYGRPKIVDYLVNISSPLDVQDSQGKTALHWASSRGHQNSVLLLLHAGADMEARDNLHNTPLHYACSNGHDSIVKALIYYSEHSQRPINVSCQNYSMDSPLHLAARWGFLGICQILTEHGAQINLPNLRQTTPINCAKDSHTLQILQNSEIRRSYMTMYHQQEDFVNIDVLKNSDKVHLLITDPKPDYSNNAKSSKSTESEITDAINDEENTDSFNFQDTTTTTDNRDETNSLSSTTSSRRTSFSSSSHRPSIRIEETLDPIDDIEKETNRITLPFEKQRYLLDSEPSSQEPVRKISVSSLNVQPAHILAQNASMGVKRKRNVDDKNLRKLFNAIAIGDIPLTLFYMGIPSSEIESVENIEIPDQIPNCSRSIDPLCQCYSCVGKNQGLGLDIDVQNLEGKSAIHLSCEYALPTLIKILYRYRANLNVRTKFENKSALEIAKERDLKDIEILLRNLGARE